MTPLDLLVRVSLVLAPAWAFVALCRRRPAAFRHWVLAAAIGCAAVAPAVTALAPAWRLPSGAAPIDPARASRAADRPTYSAPGAVEAEIAFARVKSAASTRPRPRISPMTVAGWLWVAGAVAGLLALATGLARLTWIGLHARPLDDPIWADVQAEVARAYGLSRRAAILQTDRPLLVTWGVVAPKILVPSGAAAWSRERIRIVLAHELAHVRRRDWLTQMGAEIVRAVHWCNPLAWIVCRRTRLESEHACDDAVLNLGIAGSDYASHLLDLARAMRGRAAAWVPAEPIVRPSSLERRVAAMLNARIAHAAPTRAARFTAGVALVLVTTFAAGFTAAQGTTGLSGTVVDQFGRMMPNTPISLRDLTTNARHEVTTDGAGHYGFAALPSGDYMLTVNAPGFRKVEERIVLTGAEMTRNVAMQLGRVQESITVSGGAPSIRKPPVTREEAQRMARERKIDDCGAFGGCIAPPLKIADKKPVYPATYDGPGEVVTLNAVIDTTGHVSNVRIVGQPSADLAQAAIDAVSQWEFEPTRLDGQLVETEMTVTVNFRSTK